MTAFIEYPASANLRRLLSVRSLLFVALTTLTALVVLVAGFALPVGPITAIIVAVALITLLSWWRLIAAKRPVQNVELVVQLGIDIAALTALLYFTGGWTNPLVSLYLVPIAAAVAMLPARLAWIVAVVAVLCYAFVAVFYEPLIHEGDSMTGTFTMHVVGMWLTFVIAAGLITYFGTTMAAMLRARAQALATARETNLRNEQIIGVATLAAGTAHELSTPLGSIAVIASEIRADIAPDLRSEIDLIITQIEVCKDILRRLRDAAAPISHNPTTVQHVDAFIDDVRERFQLLRPAVNMDMRLDADSMRPYIVADPTLQQAVLNLLNNAADVSPHSVDCSVHCTTNQLVLDIRDRGAGFDANGAGKAYEPTVGDVIDNGTAEGMGMGLLLANATIERLGGSVHITDREGGGAWVQVTLPLAAMPTGAS